MGKVLFGPLASTYLFLAYFAQFESLALCLLFPACFLLVIFPSFLLLLPVLLPWSQHCAEALCICVTGTVTAGSSAGEGGWPGNSREAVAAGSGGVPSR